MYTDAATLLADFGAAVDELLRQKGVIHENPEVAWCEEMKARTLAICARKGEAQRGRPQGVVHIHGELCQGIVEKEPHLAGRDRGNSAGPSARAGGPYGPAGV